MPRSPRSSLTYYPAYCFGLSPTHNEWARLTAADVHRLEERQGFEGQNIFFHLNHPIKWIRLVGVVVAIENVSGRWILVLDDSSGSTIEINCGRSVVANRTSGNTNEAAKVVSGLDNRTEVISTTGRTVDLSQIDVGTVIKAKGGIGLWRGDKQMTLERVWIVRTTNEEAIAWAEYIAFRRDVLNSPWIVSDKDQKQARRKAEGVDRQNKSRNRQKSRQIKDLREHERAAAEENTKRKNEERKRRIIEDKEQKAEETLISTAIDQKREHVKVKRDQERKSREQEYERLRRQKSTGHQDQPR